MTYTVDAGNDVDDLTIDSLSGELSLKVAADYETKEIYSVRLKAWDGQDEALQEVTINIIDTLGKQLGQNIFGEDESDFSGEIIALNDDGSKIAIAAYRNDDSGNNAGHVRTFELLNNQWVQYGGDIDGEFSGDESGVRVSLNQAGNVLAISSPSSNGGGSFNGSARVFELNSNTWQQKGSTINGKNQTDQAGYGLAINDDGSIVAIGAHRYSSDRGMVSIYEFNQGSWSQLGSDILGEGVNDESGWSVSLNSDGKVVAIGSPGNSDGTTRGAMGHVRVFEYVSSSWTQKGEDIDGTNTGDEFGFSVSISGDGNSLAIGAPNYDFNLQNVGRVEIYQWDSLDGWIGPWGDVIYGDTTNDRYGYSVQLSSDAKILGVGGIGSNNEGVHEYFEKIFDEGSTRYFEMVSFEKIKGDNTNSDKILDRRANISQDGKILAISYPENSESGTNKGKVSVFQIGGIDTETN